MNFYIGDPHLGHEAIIRLAIDRLPMLMKWTKRLSAIGTAE